VLHTQLAKKLAGKGDPFLGHLSGFQNFAGIYFLSSVREVFVDAGQRKPHVRLNIIRTWNHFGRFSAHEHLAARLTDFWNAARSTVASKHWGTRLSDRILIGNPEIRR
jgi:hypothetical protein